MTTLRNLMSSTTRPAILWTVMISIVFAAGLSLVANVPARGQGTDEEAQIAKSLATLLQAGRTVVSRNQNRINDPSIGYKGLDSKSILAETIRIYQETTSLDPYAIDPKTRHGKLIRIQLDAIAEVIDVHQQTFNRQGIGFKGFIPSLFARLVNEAFGRRAAGIAEMKVTAPPQLIRNARARPDQWEAEVIDVKLLAVSWPKNQFYAR
jgi:hypothetical protein